MSKSARGGCPCTDTFFCATALKWWSAYHELLHDSEWEAERARRLKRARRRFCSHRSKALNRLVHDVRPRDFYNPPELEPATRARYDILKHDENRIALRDRLLVDETPRMSITNDAERVLAQLHAFGYVQPPMKVVYYDSQGELSQIVYRESDGKLIVTDVRAAVAAVE